MDYSFFKVSCYFCDYSNELDLSRYGPGNHIGLHDKCDECGEVYGFDVELEIQTTSFDPKWS